jgi:hypothetical protein
MKINTYIAYNVGHTLSDGSFNGRLFIDRDTALRHFNMQREKYPRLTFKMTIENLYGNKKDLHRPHKLKIGA